MSNKVDTLVDGKIKSLAEFLKADGLTKEDNLYDYIAKQSGVSRKTVKIILLGRMYKAQPAFFEKENISPIDEHAIYHRFPQLKEILN